MRSNIAAWHIDYCKLLLLLVYYSIIIVFPSQGEMLHSVVTALQPPSTQTCVTDSFSLVCASIG